MPLRLDYVTGYCTAFYVQYCADLAAKLCLLQVAKQMVTMLPNS